MLVDKRTERRFLLFTHTKLGMVEPTCTQLAQLLQCNKDVKIIQLDNSGENIKLVQQAQGVEWRLPIEFKLMAQDMLQQNYLAEIALYCAGDLARAIMARANIPLKCRY
jgi:hypothetical protein